MGVSMLGLGNRSRKYQIQRYQLEDDRRGGEEWGMGWGRALRPEGPSHVRGPRAELFSRVRGWQEGHRVSDT